MFGEVAEVSVVRDKGPFIRGDFAEELAQLFVYGVYLFKLLFISDLCI